MSFIKTASQFPGPWPLRVCGAQISSRGGNGGKTPWTSGWRGEHHVDDRQFDDLKEIFNLVVLAILRNLTCKPIWKYGV